MKIDARVSFEKVNHEKTTDAHLVLSLTAPPRPNAAKRPDICIGLCVDISGSMAGPKLESAKKSALKVVEHLKPGDYCGIVAFESHIHVVVPPVKITAESKDRLRSEINKLRTGGGTNFSGGLLKMLDLMQRLDLPADVLHRVIMLTDGQANEGVAKTPEEIIRVLTANSGRVTASAFGYGDGVSQDFLTAFAKEGKGNYAYIDEPDAALTAFGNELGGLLSTYATDLTIEVTSLANHAIDKVVSDVAYEVEPIGNVFTLRVPDILAEETRHLVLAVKLGDQKHAFPRAVNVFEAKLSYDVIDAEGRKTRGTSEVKAKVTFVKPGEETKVSEELDVIIGLAQLVRAQIEAEELAKKGNFQGAVRVMELVGANIASRGHESLSRGAANIRKRLVSKRAYDDGSAYLNSYKTGGTRGYTVTSGQAEAMADLATAGVVMTNSVMRGTVQSFTGQGVPQGNIAGLTSQGPIDPNGVLTNAPAVAPPVAAPEIDMDGTIARMAYKE